MTDQASVKHYEAAHGRRWGWSVTIAGLLGLACILILGLWGYDRWANTLPVFHPLPPPMPSPNGYERAVALLRQLPPEPSPQGIYRRWPEAPSDALQQALAPAEPGLRAIRDTFRLQWRRPLRAPPPFPTDFSQFRGCARYLYAESLLTHDQGDDSASLQRKLDGMEMGAKMCRGGDLLALLIGVSIHAISFAGAERLVPEVPESAVLPALLRVRRIRREWSSYPEFLEVDRVLDLEGVSQAVQATQHRTPLATLAFIGDQLRSLGSSTPMEQKQAFASWLTPKRAAFASLDGYLRAVIAERRKPYPRRSPIAIPEGLIFRDKWLMPVAEWAQTFDQAEAKWWRPQIDLDLLEVALAVRLYRLENHRFPARLSDIPKSWLPAVPTDPWGQPIVYRLKNGSPLIYSIGPDGRDDGGRPADAAQLDASTRGDLVWGSLNRRRR